MKRFLVFLVMFAVLASLPAPFAAADTVRTSGTPGAAPSGKENICVVLVDGQSNADGTLGTAGNHGAIVPGEGCGYIWKDGSLYDLRAFVSQYEIINGSASTGFWPAFAAEWYALTGEKCVIINTAHAGRPVCEWAEKYTAFAAKELESCMEYLENCGFGISDGFCLWLQGESDSCVSKSSENLRYTSAPDYEAALSAIRSAYASVFSSRGIGSAFGILTCRSWMEYLRSQTASEYSGPRAAQQNFANQNDDVFMVSSITDTWSRNSAAAYSYSALSGMFSVSGFPVSSLFSEVHYSQDAYNMMGLEAADGLYRGWKEGEIAADFNLTGQNGITVYSPAAGELEGDVIYLEDNRLRTGSNNSYEKNAAQLTVVPAQSYARCPGVSITLTRASDGAEVTGIIGDNGYIPDFTQIRESMYLTVTMGQLSKTYRLTRRAVTKEDDSETVIPPVPGTGPGDTVYVDGITYTVGDDGSTVIPTGSAKVLTTYSYTGDADSPMPSGMKVRFLSNSGFGMYTVAGQDILEDVLLTEGFSFRLTDKEGIRAVTSIPADVRKKLASSGIDGARLLEYGTLVQWDSVLDGTDLTFDSPGVRSSSAYRDGKTDNVYSSAGNTVLFTNVITGITPERYSWEFSVRPYLKLKNQDGGVTVIYGAQVHRSAGSVALENIRAFAPGSPGYEYIWNIIHNVYSDAYDGLYAD